MWESGNRVGRRVRESRVKILSHHLDAAPCPMNNQIFAQAGFTSISASVGITHVHSVGNPFFFLARRTKATSWRLRE